MKDVKDFQERYNRWKNGERYWDIRGIELPKYNTGKENTIKVPLDRISIDAAGNAMIDGIIKSTATLPEIVVTPIYDNIPKYIQKPFDFINNALVEDLQRNDAQFSANRLFKHINDTRLKYKKDQDNINIKINDGGWSDKDLQNNKYVYKKYDPTSGINLLNWVLSNSFLGGNIANGEENEYWKAYLGLQNVLPKADNDDLTTWDLREYNKYPIDKKPDYYGITDRMKFYIQAMGDTLNLGKIVRKNPKSNVSDLYKFSKKLMDNPFKWQQANDEDLPYKNVDSNIINEWNPLGMLAKFGMMWDPHANKIRIHDTYDFPKYTKISIPERKNTMFIRGSVPFDPRYGSDAFNGKEIPMVYQYLKSDESFDHGKSSIHINPANRGKFNATKKRTGKTTKELTHSKNPLTRKRAIFALNASKWNKK